MLFRSAICGDIHRRAQKGKFVSIGVPQKCKASDSDESSAVIYETTSKAWTWVDLNTTDNLLKFIEVQDPALEGYDQATHTWRIYRQDKSSTGKGASVNIPAWEEIGSLIEDIILQNGLAQIHQQICDCGTNIESLEVDFNFQLHRLYCKEWRSIEEFEVYFNEGDKILIQGKNGSGKTSILSALKYAFLENRRIKEYIQHDESECLTSISFWYQSHLCEITRGSKKWGLIVDDEVIKYGSKREFEDDMHKRFPFIDYMDVFFFDEDHRKLIGDITPERKSEFISKFFRLDQIDYYNSVADKLKQELENTVRDTKITLGNLYTKISTLSGKLESTPVPQIPYDQLKADADFGLDRFRRSQNYLMYSSEKAKIEEALGMLRSRIEEAEARLGAGASKKEIMSALENIDFKIQELETQDSKEREKELDRKSVV